MATNYAPALAQTKNSESLQNYPAPIISKEQYTNENATASSVISVTPDTTAIEVAAINGPVAIRWVPTTETAAVSPFASVITIAGTTANYDHVIVTGEVRRFVIPREVRGSTGSVVGANALNGLYQRVAVKTMGVASVMLSEY